MNDHIFRRAVITIGVCIACGGMFIFAQSKFRQSSERSPLTGTQVSSPVTDTNVSSLSQTPATPYEKLSQNNITTSKDVTKGGLLQGLNLNTKQMQQVKQIRRQREKFMQQKRENAQKVKADLEKLMAGTASQNEIRESYLQFKQMRQEFADMRFENTLAIREILTPSQREKFIQKMQERRKKIQEFRERQKKQI